MAVSLSTIVARVRRGADLLDARKPGWADKVDVNTLDMQSCTMCVLGQVFGDYTEGLVYLGVDGFSLYGTSDRYLYGYSDNSSGDRWAFLTGLWQAEVAKRQQHQPVVLDAPAKPQRTRKPRYVKSAEVSVSYAPGQNVSVTRRGDVITKVTTWTTGVPNSTKRH